MDVVKIVVTCEDPQPREWFETPNTLKVAHGFYVGFLPPELQNPYADDPNGFRGDVPPWGGRYSGDINNGGRRWFRRRR